MRNRRVYHSCVGLSVLCFWLMMCLLTKEVVVAFCPSLCQCNDHTLESNCISARLDVIPILLNPALRTIKLSHNRITTLHQSLGFYTDLEQLDLSHNAIVSLGVRNLESQTRLRLLNVSFNGITDVETATFYGLNHLESLDLSGNQLKTLSDHSFHELHSLVELDLSNNQMESLSNKCFSRLHRLKSLKLAWNRLQFIPSSSFESLTSLWTLDLSNNDIAQLDGESFRWLSELRDLNVSNNTMHHIHFAAFHGLNHLVHLDLSFNRLEYVPSASLSVVRQLKFLDLSSNYMSEIGPDSFPSLNQLETLRLSNIITLQLVHPDAFQAMNESLETLIMTQNRHWTHLPEKFMDAFPRLRHLDLSFNGFQSIPPLEWPVQLEYVDFSHNPLECNCSLYWLWESHSKSNRTLPTTTDDDLLCQGPPLLHGRSFSQLQESDLQCFQAVYILLVSVVSGFIVTLSAAVIALCCWRRKQRRSSSHVKHLTHHIRQPTTLDSPHMKQKALSLPKTVDYFLTDDDYVYHPGGSVLPIPVTAV